MTDPSSEELVRRQLKAAVSALRRITQTDPRRGNAMYMIARECLKRIGSKEERDKQ